VKQIIQLWPVARPGVNVLGCYGAGRRPLRGLPGEGSPAMSDERKPGAAFRACVVTAITASVLGAYVGIYAVMVTPIQVFNFDPSGTGDDISAGYAAGYAEPWYNHDGPSSKAHKFLEAAFRPAHEIDRRVRKSVWGQRRIRPEAWKTTGISGPDILPVDRSGSGTSLTPKRWGWPE